jgi:hypothetical protein
MSEHCGARERTITAQFFRQVKVMSLAFENLKQKLTVIAAIAAIVASTIWIYRTQFAVTVSNIPLQQAIGQALAEETSRALGQKGDVVIVSMETGHAPELKVQMDAFEKRLNALGGILVKERVILDPGDNPKFRPGAGLSAKRFMKIVRKNTNVGAIASFVGAPSLTDDEMAQIKPVPIFIAEARSPEKLINLLQKKILRAAIVPRYEFPAPGPKKPSTGQQWFNYYFQIVRPESLPPKQEESP